MTAAPQRTPSLANRHAGKLLLAGLLGVGGYNWRSWRRDRALATRLRSAPPPPPALSRTPKVSVLVAAWNEHEQIDAHLRSFLALTYPDIELVLCAGGTDDTLERARRLANERVIVLEQRPGEGKQSALARCLTGASGEVLYLTDADCLFVDEALLRLLAPVIDEDEQAATGGSRPLDQQFGGILPQHLWATETFLGAHSPPYVEGLLGRNTLVTRRAIDRIGGLDFVARTGTDYHLARRLIASGIRIRYVDASVVPSVYPETIGSYGRRQSRWMRNLLLYGGQYGAYHHVRATLRTAAVGTVMLGLPLVAIRGGRGILAAWTILVVHALLSRVRYAAFAGSVRARRVPAKYFLALLSLTLADFAVWVLPILQIVSAKGRYRW